MTQEDREVPIRVYVFGQRCRPHTFTAQGGGSRQILVISEISGIVPVLRDYEFKPDDVKFALPPDATGSQRENYFEVPDSQKQRLLDYLGKDQ